MQAEIAGTRHSRASGRGERVHKDREAHAKQLERRAQELAAVHVRRRATLGVDPRLVLVFELVGTVDAGAFRGAGLLPLGGTQAEAVVAFTDDPQLHGFLERVRKYREAGNEVRYAPHESFVDVVRTIRAYGPADRLTPRLRNLRARADGGTRVDVQLDLWHPGDERRAEEWGHQTEEAVLRAGGDVVDRYTNHGAGLLLIRARVDAAAIDALAQIDEIALIDGVPSLPPNRARPKQATLDELPEVPPAAVDAPLVGVIDSGVRSGHPLVAPALYDATTLCAEFEDGEDAHGHGTRIAALLLHGQLDDVLDQGWLPRPFCRVLSVRVLDGNNRFPSGRVWEAEIERAIRFCAEQGAKVVNLSVADPDTPYTGAHSTPVAALVDQLSRELQIVIVVPTGNVPPAAYFDLTDPNAAETYPVRMLESAETVLLDPAPAATAVTVGAVAPDALGGATRPTFAANRRALREGGWPAPYTRRGPGVGGAVKPEVVAAGGSLALDVEFGQLVSDDALGIVSASGAAADRLLDIDIGTSFAAPLVARVATAVHARYPAFGANLIRALTVLGCREARYCDALADLKPGEREKRALPLVGYGEARLAEAIESTPHRAILVTEGELRVDRTNVYEIPIPSSFRTSGGARGIDVALSFDPETRARRLDYSATKMEFWLVRGMSPDDITEVFMSIDANELERLEAQAEAADAADEGDEDDVPERVTPSKLGASLVKLAPSGQVRSRGANQLARIRFGQRLKDEYGDTYHLVVQCRRVWSSLSSPRQSFGLAVALWRDEDQPAIYDELRARVEAPVEVPVEIELRR